MLSPLCFLFLTAIIGFIPAVNGWTTWLTAAEILLVFQVLSCCCCMEWKNELK